MNEIRPFTGGPRQTQIILVLVLHRSPGPLFYRDLTAVLPSARNSSLTPGFGVLQLANAFEKVSMFGEWLPEVLRK